MSRSRTKISKTARASVYKRDGHRCVECAATKRLTLDHIVPLSKGGSNRQDNLQTLCVPCNEAKADLLTIGAIDLAIFRALRIGVAAPAQRRRTKRQDRWVS